MKFLTVNALTLGLAFGLIFYRSVAFACSLKQSSSWFLDDKQLVEATATIFEGRVVKRVAAWSLPWRPKKFEYTFEVLKVFKGKTDSNQVVLSFTAQSSKVTDERNASYGPDCALTASFEEGQLYLIFVNSFNPNGYKRLEGPEDARLKSIDQLIGGKK